MVLLFPAPELLAKHAVHNTVSRVDQILINTVWCVFDVGSNILPLSKNECKFGYVV
jgi:hypothetical protein